MKYQMAVLKRKLRASLKSQCLTEVQISATMSATFGSAHAAVLTTIPRKTISKQLALLNAGGRGTAIAIKLGNTGKLRVYTMAGYNGLQAQGKRIGMRPRAPKYHVAAK